MVSVLDCDLTNRPLVNFGCYGRVIHRGRVLLHRDGRVLSGRIFYANWVNLVLCPPLSGRAFCDWGLVGLAPISAIAITIRLARGMYLLKIFHLPNQSVKATAVWCGDGLIGQIGCNLTGVPGQISAYS